MPRGPPPKSPKEMASPETLARLHKAVTAHYQAIAQDFENFDTSKVSTVSRDEFRAICTRYVQILTDEQGGANITPASRPLGRGLGQWAHLPKENETIRDAGGMSTRLPFPHASPSSGVMLTPAE
ncbi:EF-hand calcium binding domain 6 [Phyllostomus discolor]|uniref:EF-hand calcium binding domain 6 n=1 Tax=Phyllostomus discolor TaxID=89673 RepID=A0A834AWF5_9CHIR|nr:EF-hand calcium binding domain 6 [Phyllostomus discolor]